MEWYRDRRRPGTEKPFCINTWRIYDPNASQGTLANIDISRGIQERGRFMRWNLRPWAQGTEQFFRIITRGMRLSVDEREPLRPRSRFISMRKVFCPTPTATVIFRHAHQRPMNIPSEESIGFEGHRWYIARYFVHCSRLEVTLDFPCAVYRSFETSLDNFTKGQYLIYIYIYIYPILRGFAPRNSESRFDKIDEKVCRYLMNGARTKSMANTFTQRLNVLYVMYIHIYTYDRVNDRILMAFQLSDRVSRYLANEISQRIKYSGRINPGVRVVWPTTFLFHSIKYCNTIINVTTNINFFFFFYRY